MQGEFRQQLAPFPVTPLQAGVILYLHRQREASMTETAAGVGVAGSTLSVAVRALVRKRWVTEHRTPNDRRIVRLRLTQGVRCCRENHSTYSRRAKQPHLNEGGLIMTRLRLVFTICLLLTVVGVACFIPFGLSPVFAVAAEKATQGKGSG